MSSLFREAVALAGVFSIALGVIHLWIPRIFAFGAAIGEDDRLSAGGSALGTINIGGFTYTRRRSDAIGLTWVMSNAASYVLITIGIIDLAWAAGDRTIPLTVGAAWIAGWWALRAIGQFVVGRRIGDMWVALGFAALTTLHLTLATGLATA